MFTVDLRPQSKAQQEDAQSSDVTQETLGINLLAIVDPSYFTAQSTSQNKLEQMRYRKIHSKSVDKKDLNCSFELNIEIGQVQLALFGGRDFDFDNTEVLPCNQIVFG